MKIFYLLTLLVSTTFAAPIGLTSLVGAIARRSIVLSPNVIARGLHVFPKDSVEQVTARANQLSNSIIGRWDGLNGVGLQLPCISHYCEKVLSSDRHSQDRDKIWTPEVRNDLKRFLPEAQGIIAKLKTYPVEKLLPCVFSLDFADRPASLLLELRAFESLIKNNLYTNDISSRRLQMLLKRFKGIYTTGFRDTDEFEKKTVPTCNRIVSSFNEVFRRDNLSVRSAVSVGNSISDVADAYNLIPRELTQEERAISEQRKEFMELKRHVRKIIAEIESKLAILIGEPSTSTYFFLEHPNLGNIGADASLEKEAMDILALGRQIAELKIEDSWACEAQRLILEECERAFEAACVGAAVVPDLV